ncbi:hypothetical protein JKP88DRAFT_203159 [Tribonema minus]|uniref:Uncharacterized protein n=1 Tax=Tribonema minus TaxID=303371 RepID=A0A835YLY2_9STRA|nr:hypothetical protein JKP88DRAFT_203159 [Tribonema minus]
MTADPGSGRYLLYEIPAQTTLPQSLLGLTSAFLLAMLSGRALLVQWTKDYEAPGPSDIGGGAGDWDYGANATAVPHDERRSSLEEIFLDPGFWWSWDRFMGRWTGRFERAAAEIDIVVVNVSAEVEALACGDLRRWRVRDQFVKVAGAHYFAPALAVNARHADALFAQLPRDQLFAYLSNWLLRPVPTVMTAVHRFAERYFEDNYVIGLEMSLWQALGEWGTMTAAQQKRFFQEAADATYRATQALRGVMILVVTDDEEALRARLKGQPQDALGAAGIIAITGPRGTGTRRILTELQEVWLLGYADVCIVSPASPTGVVGHARTGRAPIVVAADGGAAHASAATQPCFADLAALRAASCFRPDMLAQLSIDPEVPCVDETGWRRRLGRQRGEGGGQGGLGAVPAGGGAESAVWAAGGAPWTAQLGSSAAHWRGGERAAEVLLPVSQWSGGCGGGGSGGGGSRRGVWAGSPESPWR